MQRRSYEGPRQLGPGERIDLATGRVLYSAAWLSGLRAVPEPPRLFDVRVSVYPVRDPVHDEKSEARLSLFTEIRVAASCEREALDLAARRLLERDR